VIVNAHRKQQHPTAPFWLLAFEEANNQNGRRVHSNMQVWTEIRRKVLVEKVPKRQICRDYNISFHTSATMLEFVEPPGYQQGPASGPGPSWGPSSG
jgi:hypothetical protein